MLGGCPTATPHIGWSRSDATENLLVVQRLALGRSEWHAEHRAVDTTREIAAGWTYRLDDALDVGGEAGRRTGGEGEADHGIALRARMRW